jgi:1,4-alpha-glucan branching enzyme
MHKLFLIALFSVNAILSLAQVAYTENPFPKEDQPLNIYFNAALGNMGLKGYTGDIYAHTGVLTQNSTGSSDWKHVKTTWGQNTPETKLERIGTDLYKLVIQPSSRDYYGLTTGETIVKLAFVFRSETQVNGAWKEGKTDTGSDIFLEMYNDAQGFQVAFVNPEKRTFFCTLGQNLSIKVASSANSNLFIYKNNQLIASQNGVSSINTNDIVSAKGNYRYMAVGVDGQMRRDTAYFQCIIPEDPIIQDFPVQTPLGLSRYDNGSIRLRLQAPLKSYVFVVGTFNDYYLDNNFQMKKSSNGEDFWLEINGIASDKNYTYQYVVDQSITVADPCSELILDPNNDKYIPSSTYSNIPTYPVEKTTGIVSSFSVESNPYQWSSNTYAKPEKAKLIIYECLVRDFSNARSFQAIIDSLGYLKKLGINALELMPVNEFEGNISWGYNPSFHMAIDKYYGSINKLKELVDKCHQSGIAVIMDVVFNHAFSQSPLCQMYWDQANFRPSANSPYFNTVAKHPFNVGYDFNHESKFTKAYMDRILGYLITEFKVDGFRFDLSKGFTQVYNTDVGLWGAYDASRISILKRMAAEIRKVDPNVFLILEHFAVNSEEQELSNEGFMLWGNGNYDYLEGAMGYTSNFSNQNYKTRGWSSPNLVSYMESHDEERMGYKLKNFGNSNGAYNTRVQPTFSDRINLSNLFFLLIPGPKMIWQFGELGYDYSINTCENFSINTSCRLDPKPVRWDFYQDANRRKTYQFIGDLSYLKKTFNTFSQSDFDFSLNSTMKYFRWNDSEMNAFAVGNFGVQANSISIPIQKVGWWYDYISGDSIEILNQNETFNLQPGEYKLMLDKRINRPNLSTNTNENVKFNNTWRLFPNPVSSDILFLKNLGKEISEAEAEIVNINGQIIWRDKLVFSGQTAELSIRKIPAGFYSLVLKNKAGLYYSSFIKI